MLIPPFIGIPLVQESYLSTHRIRNRLRVANSSPRRSDCARLPSPSVGLRLARRTLLLSGRLVLRQAEDRSGRACKRFSRAALSFPVSHDFSATLVALCRAAILFFQAD